MGDDDELALATVESCWITGGAAFEAAPARWKNAAGDDPADRERCLVALAGQSALVAHRPKPPQGLAGRPRLPLPDLEIIPDSARGAFRQALKQTTCRIGAGHILALLQSRGFAAHPFDWMPGPGDIHVPDIYIPLAEWAARGETSAAAETILTADNWEDFFPAARRSALASLRASQPEQALALMAEKFGGEVAETRAGLMDVLAVNPTPADIPFLTGLLKDRSGKVRSSARQYLARLGQPAADEDRTSEDAFDHVEVKTKGILKRSRVFSPVKPKTAGLLDKRQAFFLESTLKSLADAFEVSGTDFIQSWEWGRDSDADELFVDMTGRTGSDQDVSVLKSILFERSGDDPQLSGLLRGRLAADDVREWQIRLMDSEPRWMERILDHDLRAYGWMTSKQVLAGRMYQQTEAALREGTPKETARAEKALQTIALLADRQAALDALERLAHAGLGIGANETALLRLNSLLDPKSKSSRQKEPS